MKYTQHLALFAMVAFSLSAFAADTHSGKFTLTDTVHLGSIELTPGDYKAEWTGPTDAVKVNILKNGKTVATAEGKIRDLQRPSPYDAVLVKPGANDTKAIDEIDFSHRTEALVLGGE